MTYNFIKWSTLQETNEPKTLVQATLNYKRDDLEPSISEEAMGYHFGKLYKTYVDRYNAGEGDPDFNESGAFLHEILFTQYRASNGSNDPVGNSLAFIEKHFKSFDKFKEEFAKTAMAIQGSGWVYLANDGKIKTIKNHEIKRDIVLLVDWWEHSWVLDYQADKKGYLANQWKIIDWNIINARVGQVS